MNDTSLDNIIQTGELEVTNPRTQENVKCLALNVERAQLVGKSKLWVNCPPNHETKECVFSP